MTALENFVSPALTRALGWTLLHSLWQGALVAAVLAGALLLLRRQRAEVRYVASAGALGLVVALAGITFGLYLNSGAEPQNLGSFSAAQAALVIDEALPQAETVVTAMPEAGRKPVTAPHTVQASVETKAVSQAPAPTSIRSFTHSLIRSLTPHLPLLVLGWLLGLLAMGLRMLGGLLYVQRLKRYRTRAVSAAWQERLAVLAARGGLRRPVALLESALVQVPLVVGHVRPIILLPLGAVAGLSVAHLEAILAHELAHVLRRDYLVNLLQTVAEALFFYHPAVWFMARCVRTERENCCDDAATALCDGDALRLARALTALAEWGQSAVVTPAPRLALAAMGSRGALLNRVRRLVQRRPAAPTLAEGFMAGALVLGGLGLLGGSAVLAGPLAQPTTPAKPGAIDWQTGLATPKDADTTKHVTNSSSTTTTVATTTQTGEAGQAVIVTQNNAAPDQDRPRPRRRDRRSAPLLTPVSLSGNPGTVVITKDKKGRVTDLVVNGQRIETEAGKSKLKIKAKKDRDNDDQSVQIIQVPMTAPVARGFVYRSDDDGQRQLFERSAGPGQTFSYQLRELQPLRSPQFRALTLNGNRGFQRLKISPNEPVNRTFYRQPGAFFGLAQDGDSQREALRSAERALQDASSAKGLSAEQRKRIASSLEKVRAELKQLNRTSSTQRLSLRGADVRDLAEEMRNREEELRDREQELLDRQQEKRDREQEIRERQQEAQVLREEMRERIHEEKAERADRERERADRRREQDDALVDQLLKDGLIKDKENFQLKLTASSLTVNGKVQSQKVFQKYLKLYESTHPGRKMGPNGSMVINRNSSQSTSYDSEGPRPPRPPRPPRAPQAPGAMMAPPAPMTPPAPMSPPPPPAPPRVDSDAVLSELRKDGLIGADDKSFQLQLNSSGLKVNGKEQSAEMTAKYRKLLGHDKGTYNMTISND